MQKLLMTIGVIAFMMGSPQDGFAIYQDAEKTFSIKFPGTFKVKQDSRVEERKNELIEDSKLIIEKINELDTDGEFEDPLSSPEILTRAVKTGILDAPHLCGVEAARGKVMTMFIGGKNIAVDHKLNPLKEKERLDGLDV